MSRAEKFIEDYTRNCSNEYLTDSKPDGLGGYISRRNFTPWLTPCQARKAVEIAREETIKEVCEWLDNHNDYICGSTNGIARYDMDKLIEDLKKHLEGKA